MSSLVFKTLGALLVLILAAGALPVQASCHCTMPPTAPSCCDAPSSACASSELAGNGCQAVFDEEAAIQDPVREWDAASRVDESECSSSVSLRHGVEATPGPAPNTFLQNSHISIFELDCCYLI